MSRQEVCTCRHVPKHERQNGFSGVFRRFQGFGALISREWRHVQTSRLDTLYSESYDLSTARSLEQRVIWVWEGGSPHVSLYGRSATVLCNRTVCTWKNPLAHSLAHSHTHARTPARPRARAHSLASSFPAPTLTHVPGISAHARTHSRTHSLTHSLTHPPTHARTHSLTRIPGRDPSTHAHTHTRTHSRTHSRTWTSHPCKTSLRGRRPSRGGVLHFPGLNRRNFRKLAKHQSASARHRVAYVTRHGLQGEKDRKRDTGNREKEGRLREERTERERERRESGCGLGTPRDAWRAGIVTSVQKKLNKIKRQGALSRTPKRCKNGRKNVAVAVRRGSFRHGAPPTLGVPPSMGSLALLGALALPTGA